MFIINMFLCLLFLKGFPVVRAELSVDSSVDLAGVHRQYGHASDSSKSMYDLFVESFLSAKYSSGSWSAEGKLLLRHLQSPSNQNEESWSYVSLIPPERLLDLGKDLSKEGSSGQTYLDTASLWIGYEISDIQFSLGRKALGIGVLIAFPVWNRLYPVVPTPSGYLFFNNPDLVDMRWQNGSLALTGYHVFSQNHERELSSFEVIHYGEKLESHFLVGRWWEQAINGYSGILDSALGIFRFESLFVYEDAELDGGAQWGAGYERALTETTSFLFEYYYSSFGARESEKYFDQAATPFRVLLAQKYFFSQFSLKPTNLSVIRLGNLMNLIDESSFLQVLFEYSLKDDVILELAFRKPLGGKGDEFGYIPSPVVPGLNLEYSQFISATLKAFF